VQLINRLENNYDDDDDDDFRVQSRDFDEP